MTPGLISREIVREDNDTVTIKEVWDLKSPNCPIVAYHVGDRFEKNTEAMTVTRIIREYR